jgi:hypothetical protein
MKSLRLLLLTATVATIAFGQAITTTSLPNGTINQPYSQQINCTNCTGYVWNVYSGALPSGLSLGHTTGLISGTPITTGAASFVVGIVPLQSSFLPTPVTQALTITINGLTLAINQTAIPGGFTGQAYSTTLTGTGGTPPYAWALSGTGNDGLTIGRTTGILAGTPTAAGTFPITVVLTDSANSTALQTYSLSVVTGLSILTASFPNGTVGTAYPQQVLSAGGGQPPYRWTVTAGGLPTGLTLNGVYGNITGTPTAAGAYPFTLTVTDYQLNTASANFTITVVGGAITIAPTTLPAGAVGTSYTQTLTATGGVAPYTWAVSAGTLPVGLALNASSGVLSGTPTAPGASSFTVQATDSTQATGRAAYTLAVTGPLTITTTSLPDGTTGSAYSQTLAAIGGTTPYSWSITAGTLPAGLALNATSGAITGNPTTVGSSTFTVTVTDATRTTATQSLTLAIDAPLTLTPSILPAASVGVVYSQKFTAAGGKGPYTYALTGTLPAGFTFTASTATLTGTAPAAESGSFTITATDSLARTATVQVTLTVTGAPLSVTPTSLPAATVGTAYTQTLTVTGGVSPYKFAVTSGSLPAGFSLNATNGTISGTATAAETGTFTVTVTDSTGATLPVTLTLTANAVTPPSVTITGLPVATGFEQQLVGTLAVGSPYPVAITGVTTLTFTPSVTPSAGVDDLLIEFSNGSRTLNFTIPAGSTTATLNNASSITVLTGTTAGTITLTTVLTDPNGNRLGTNTTTIVTAAGVPFISNVTLTQVPGGVNVTVTGFSSTRDMINGQFAFVSSSNSTFTYPNVSVPLNTAFTTWWAMPSTTNAYGTQFSVTVPFTITNPQDDAISNVVAVSVTVTLENSKGASNPVTLSQ